MATIVRLRGIKKVRSKGHVYYYHRATGERLQAEPGTAAFVAEVAALERRPEGVPVGQQPQARILGNLIAAYRGSPEFARLAASTREDYQHVFDYVKPLEGVAIPRFTAPFLYKMRDKAFARHKRRFANYVVQVIRLLFAWGIPRGWLKANPARDVPLIERPRDTPKANRAWSIAEYDAMVGRATGGLRIAIMLGFWAGLTEGDIVRLPRAGAYDRIAGFIDYRRRKTGVEASIHVAGELRAAIEQELARTLGPKAKVTPATLVCNRWNRPFTESGIRSSFAKLRAPLLAEGKVKPGLTIHGLRHSISRDVIDAGGSVEEAAAVNAQTTDEMGNHYSRERNRQRLAKKAVGRIEKERKRARLGKPFGKPRQTG
ncbi:integrase [Hypericibacter terrae]|uniref:Integrase n=1 Tax=Hypericibacter terrae TaxID=2602015 RepID=A0A5J6MMW9_9PROT|nr:hypothetical protein [Hypericibacter terrae]QEX18541.1 integrase [Hypericibacter terrae]